jgi:hypothetical protein
MSNKMIFPLLALAPFVAVAQPPTRDALMDRIEAEFVAGTIVAADSPAVTSMLGPAMTANPGVTPETWQSVEVELAGGLTKLITERGGSFDVLIRNSLSSLSDKELQSLGDLLGYPAYKKFQSAMSSPATQQQMQFGMAKVGMEIGPLINTILVNHQLHEVH